MKIKTTLITLAFLLVIAQGGTTVVNWAGNWDTKSESSDTACYPDKTILIEQDVDQITASWIWANSQPCTQVGLAGQKFTQSVQNLQGNSLTLKITAITDSTFTVDGDKAVFESNNGASSSTYSRRQKMVYWAGTWDIVTQSASACNPDKSLTLTQSASYISASWTWANSEPCQQAGLAGTKFAKSSIAIPPGNAVYLKFQSGSAEVEGMVALMNDQAIFASVNGVSATFARRQELVNWVGTWDLYDSDGDDYVCYPDKFVTVLPSGGNLIASWTWQNSKSCTQVGLAGRPFSQAVPVPKGSALFLNFIVGDAYVSGILRKNGDNKTVFFSRTDAAAYFKRRSQMVNWAGVWDLATQDKTACYPTGGITVAQTSSDITISWTYTNTSPCLTLELAGKKVSKTITTPTENSVKLDVSTTVSVLFTVFLDGAVFSTTGGASTYIRRQENVAFAGTWNIQNQDSITACYPDTSIIITQDGDSVTTKWTWATSVQCKEAGLAGKEFAQTGPTPRGRAIFLDILAGTARVSGIFTINGNQATFASNNGASAIFTRDSSSNSATEPESEPSTESSTDSSTGSKNDTSTEPSTNPKNGSSSTGLIALILIVVFAIGAYFYIQKARSKKLEEEDLNSSFIGANDRTKNEYETLI